LYSLISQVLNRQTKIQSPKVAQKHYDLGNDIYEAMLDQRMQYTCGYWKDAKTLDKAQENKLRLICHKIQLAPRMTVLELGGGFGGLAHFMASEFGCRVVSFDLAGYPTKPLSSFHAYRQLHGWIPPPQVIFADSAHC
jgi:cyclopropane-fatty-acyl-phospholipid synthase